MVLGNMNFWHSSNAVRSKFQNPCYAGTPWIFLCVIQVCNFSTLQGIIIFVPRSQSPHANMPISIFWRKQFWVELETDERVVFVVQLKIRQSIAAVQWGGVSLSKRDAGTYAYCKKVNTLVRFQSAIFKKIFLNYYITLY